MRLLLCLMAILALAGCGGYRTVQPSELVIQRSVAAPGQSRGELFKKSKQWLAGKYPATRSTITYESPDGSILVSSGSLINHAFSNALVTFTMQNEISDGAIRSTCTLENVESGSYKRRMTESFGEEIDGARGDINELISSLESYVILGLP